MIFATNIFFNIECLIQETSFIGNELFYSGKGNYCFLKTIYLKTY